MSLTESSRFSQLSSFLHVGKRSPSKNFDFISKSFDENLLRRIKALLHHPSTDLSWLSLAVDILCSIHADAETLISDLKSSSSSFGSENTLKLYFDHSVKVLDVCNSITLEIERLHKSRLFINFILHLLDFSGETPSAEKLRCARKALSEWTPVVKKSNLNLQNPAILMRELAGQLCNPPRGKISSVAELVERTFYAVGVVTVLVSRVVVGVLTGSWETIQLRVPNEFLWGDSFNTFQSATEKLHGWENGRLDERVIAKSICNLIDDVSFPISKGSMDELEKEIKELVRVKETFLDGLDRLSDGVNTFFNTVLCTRSRLLQEFRMVTYTKGNILSK